MNDLSQRVGVGVESLAKFRKAAVTSGTDIDGVAKSLAKLSKGMYEAAQTGKGATAEALQELGISATDAAGKLKTADQVTLEIANKFKEMPDGVEKTALAMRLFGKSGAEMIPMLNMGGDAIDKLSVKMTKAFAEKADEYSDRLAVLSGKVGGLAMGLTVALLPALDAITSALTAVVDGFTQLPEPIQAIIGSVALFLFSFAALEPIISLVLTVMAAFKGIGIAATVAGWLGALQPFLAWIGSTFVPTLLAFFSGPVGWTVLAVAAVVTMVALFREPIWNFLTWLGEQFAKIPEKLAGMGEALKNTLLGILTWLQENTAGFFQGFLEGMNTMLTAVGDALRAGITSAWDWIKKRAEDLQKFFTKIPENIGKAFKTAFDVAVKAIRGAINTVIQAAGNAVNAFIQSVNNMIARINSMSARVGISLVSVPQVQIPRFAYGAYVTKSTVAEFGERRPEYAIPDDMMARASLNYLQGARGGAVLNSTPRTAAGGGGGGSVNVSVQTGDVIQMPGMDEPMMLLSDGAAMVREAVAQTLSLLNSSEGRVAGAF
jgi:hypothetical protein